MDARRRLKALGKMLPPPKRRFETADLWLALYVYGANAAQVTERSAADLLTMDRDTDHAADPSTGCAGCALLAELFYATTQGRAVGGVSTWRVSDTTATHLRRWLRRWRLTAPPGHLAAFEALLAEVA